MKTSVLAAASCFALAGAAFDASAAGLGKIVVLSSLGQPLRAEIELTASREEMTDMRAQLASADAFKQAGIDLVPSLLGIRFSIDKRPNGQSILKLTSDRPLNDPFVDVLLELNWATGRLVREYTFLLDPPEMAVRSAPTQAQSPAPKPSLGRVEPASVAPASSIDDGVRSRAREASRPGAAKAVEAPTRPSPRTEAAATPAPTEAKDARLHQVQRGETLRKIANETKPEGVSLEQMLVGLLRANRDAFDGGNMNRLRTGRVLTVPEKSEVEAVSTGEAKKIVAKQSSDWNAYRDKLAAVAERAPAKDGEASQMSGGRVTAKVEDKAGAENENKDRLQVSRTESGSAQPAKPGVRGGEDAVAQNKALKEANDRVALLEKNIADLQKLLEMKNQSLADLQKQASAKGEVAPVPPPKPAEVVKPVDAPKPAEPVAAEASKPATPADAPKPAEPVKPVEAAPQEATKAVEPPKSVEPPKPAEAPKPVEAAKPKVVTPPPPPPPEPSLIDDLLDNPLTLLGGGGIAALLAGLLIARRRRAAKAEEPPIDLSSTLTPNAGSSLTSNSVFRNTGGQSVDTSRTPVQTDFSQAGPGSIDTDEVDPVAEADVYMAYGRDAQAEEILLEAKQKDPQRYAIHLKLLEIYANRKDMARFETLAGELYTDTGGVGADWEKAVVIGRRVDPTNPLYGGAGQAPAEPAKAAFAADATIIAGAAAAGLRNTVTLPGELSQMANEAGASTRSVESAPVANMNNLDFDLGLPEEKTPAAPAPAPVVEETVLDFDLGGTPAPAPVASAPVFEPTTKAQVPVAPMVSEAAPAAPLPDLDFDLGSDVPVKPTAAPSATPALPQSQEENSVEFDVSLTESTFLGRSVPGANSFDMSSIDLDLDLPPIQSEPVSPPAPSAPSVAPRTPYASPMSPPEPQAADGFEREQVSTAVNPDFGSAQLETVVNPALAGGFEQDQAETMLAPELGAADFGGETALTSVPEISSNEEVATKLDLAKAYEEMGDLEGARELLQEVLKEGDVGQREKAQSLLSRIGQ